MGLPAIQLQQVHCVGSPGDAERAFIPFSSSSQPAPILQGAEGKGPSWRQRRMGRGNASGKGDVANACSKDPELLAMSNALVI